MSKLNITIFLLIGFIIYKGINFKKKGVRTKKKPAIVKITSEKNKIFKKQNTELIKDVSLQNKEPAKKNTVEPLAQSQNAISPNPTLRSKSNLSSAVVISPTYSTKKTYDPPPQVYQEKKADFDSLNDLNPERHVEGIPVEKVAVPVEKLTPDEMEQYQISLYEQKIVSETGTKVSTPAPTQEPEDKVENEEP